MAGASGGEAGYDRRATARVAGPEVRQRCAAKPRYAADRLRVSVTPSGVLFDMLLPAFDGSDVARHVDRSQGRRALHQAGRVVRRANLA